MNETSKSAQQDEREADGWELVRVKNLGPLIDALDRASRKGYLPDAMEMEWEAFEFHSAQQVQAGGDDRRIKGLRELCGYVENGSDTVVKIFQDDATREWVVKVGERSYYGASFYAAIDAALPSEQPQPSNAAVKRDGEASVSSLLKQERPATSSDPVPSADIDELITSPTVRADEIDAEAVNAGIDSIESDFSVTADADPHSDLALGNTALHDSSLAQSIQAKRKKTMDNFKFTTAACTNSDVWNCKYCDKTTTCEALAAQSGTTSAAVLGHLSPCPFCGGMASSPEVEQIEHAGWVGRIACDHCDAVVSLQYSSTSPGIAGNAVIAAWNCRAGEQPSNGDREGGAV